MSELLDMIPTEMRRVGHGEYAGPCPQCGGEDRFSVTIEPDAPGGALFQCKGASVGRAGCDWAGDGISFLRDYYGHTYTQARFALGLAPDEWTEGEEDEMTQQKRRERERARKRKAQRHRASVRREWIRSHMAEEEREMYARAEKAPDAKKVLRQAEKRLALEGLTFDDYWEGVAA